MSQHIFQQFIIKMVKHKMEKWTKITRKSGLDEWVCLHGVGHPDYKSAKKIAEINGHKIDTWLIHGCDSCCMKSNFPGKKKVD